MSTLYKTIIYIYKFLVFSVLARVVNHISIKANGVNMEGDFIIRGFMYLDCHRSSVVTIGSGFIANSGFFYNHIGRQQVTSLVAKPGASIRLGNNVGMSSTTIVALKDVTIGNNVRIGGNVVIYDSDFHSLNLEERIARPEIKTNIRSRKVLIEDNVFIGANATILKGSHVGRNSVIGACSVVSGTIPPGEIWAGNPAKFIKKVE